MGDRSQRLRVLETTVDGECLNVRLEGRSGRTCRLKVVTERDIASLDSGRVIATGELEVAIPEGIGRGAAWSSSGPLVRLGSTCVALPPSYSVRLAMSCSIDAPAIEATSSSVRSWIG